MTHIKRYGLWLATATEAADADPREVAACLNLAAGCLDDAAKELDKPPHASTPAFYRPVPHFLTKPAEIPTEDLLALMESYRVAFADLTLKTLKRA